MTDPTGNHRAAPYSRTRWVRSARLGAAFTFIFLSLAVLPTPAAQAQDTPPGEPAEPLPGVPEIRVNRGGRLPAAAFDQIQAINFKNTDLRDIFRAVAEESGLNLVIDDRITERATVALRDLSVLDALVFLAEEYELSLIQSGSVFRVLVPDPGPPPPAPVPRPIDVLFRDGLITADFRGDPVERVVRLLAEATGETILLSAGTSGTVSGLLQRVPFETGLRRLLETNGFAVRLVDGVYVVDQGFLASPEEPPVPGSYVRVDSTGVELRLEQADAARVLRELARQSGDGIVTYSLPQGRTITASAAGLSVEEALGVVLRGTGISFRREPTPDGSPLWVVGSREGDGITATELIRLGFTRVDGVEPLLPSELAARASVQVVPEQNALLVTGSNDAIAEVRAFVRALDYPAPQILIEALVVDYLDTEATRFGFTFGQGSFAGDSLQAQRERAYRLDGLGDGAFTLEGDGGDVNYALREVEDFFGIGSIGRLPADFYFRIEALAREGKLEIRSRPQIATLSGNTASLSIGTTQYFILETENPLLGQGQVVVQTSERFEKIEANVSLEVTPFVSQTGEVTVNIKPEFSTPVGQFQPDVPPTISSRVFESNVRLRDGETIILGGLISDEEVIDDNKIPILGDIPVLGWLFRSRVRSTRRSELVIYLTPHVFYGDGRDQDRWRALSEELELHDEGVFLVPSDLKEGGDPEERVDMVDDAEPDDEMVPEDEEVDDSGGHP